MANKKRGRAPRTDKRLRPRDDRKPSGEPPKTAAMPLAWRVRDLDAEWDVHCGCWRELSADDLNFIREKLGHYETMTVGEVFLQQKHYNHAVPLMNLIPAARRRLEELGLGDLDVLHRLRLAGKPRVWGILNENVVRLIWYDPEHEICPSAKKGT